MGHTVAPRSKAPLLKSTQYSLLTQVPARETVQEVWLEWSAEQPRRGWLHRPKPCIPRLSTRDSSTAWALTLFHRPSTSQAQPTLGKKEQIRSSSRNSSCPLATLPLLKPFPQQLCLPSGKMRRGTEVGELTCSFMRAATTWRSCMCRRNQACKRE